MLSIGHRHMEFMLVMCPRQPPERKDHSVPIGSHLEVRTVRLFTCTPKGHVSVMCVLTEMFFEELCSQHFLLTT